VLPVRAYRHELDGPAPQASAPSLPIANVRVATTPQVRRRRRPRLQTGANRRGTHAASVVACARIISDRSREAARKATAAFDRFTDMGELPRARPVMVGDLLLDERRTLLEFLVELQPEDWERPTECPAWTVRGICLHLLGDDLSLLSRQRDERPSPVALAADAKGWDQLFILLDQFNETWVDAASFLSTPLLRQLLQLTGDWTHAWYTSVDPERLGEPVAWAGPEPAPYWLNAAREYLERWIHHEQIRRALNATALDEARWVVPAVATAVRGFPAGFSGSAPKSGPPSASCFRTRDGP
jgi:uncharacterized protein (TIGR03083 family)